MTNAIDRARALVAAAKGGDWWAEDAYDAEAPDVLAALLDELGALLAENARLKAKRAEICGCLTASQN